MVIVIVCKSAALTTSIVSRNKGNTFRAKIRLQEMLVPEIVEKSMIKEETLRDYISRKAEWYIPATEAIT